MSNAIEKQINDALAAFSKDPKTFMNRQPQKMDEAGNPIQGATLFSQSAIDSKAYIEARDQQRMQILQPGEGEVTTRAAIASNDKPVNLVDSLTYTTLAAMESANLMKANLAESPWSDDYWGIYKGIIAARYADPSFPASSDWKQNYDYVRANTATSILASGNASRINNLSPAEKYDALVGDSSESLTKQMWAEGKSYYDANGSVETWMGICHGWSPAAYMLPRPTSSVTLKTPSNVPITFYPSDIKALGSLLWANAPGSLKYIGGRCNDKDPATDPTTGRIKSGDCFDTNPGTWHLSVVNQIDASRRGMVMDVTFDYEVWNQPVYAYEYRYFNPQTMVYASTLAEATLGIAAFTSDKFHAYRSPQTKFVVGVRMDVSYVVETQPSHTATNSPSSDAIQKVAYYYDLELDASNTIIGGEWYQNKHPDFLWTPGKGIRAQTRYESQATGTWKQTDALPSSWRTAAKSAASSQSSPLAAIVENILQFANSGTRSVAPSAPSPSPAPAAPAPTPAPAPRSTPAPTPAPAPAPSSSWWPTFLSRWFG